MSNNAELGMTIQKCICDMYKIQPNSYAASQFESSYNSKYQKEANNVILKIFKEIGYQPQECLTFTKSSNARETLSPHNFILSNGNTFSIRTTMKGDKIAPRVVGQAGINTFNEHFSKISGYDIKDKNEIKEIVFNNIHLMMPTFIDYIFLSDYTVWVQITNDNKFEYTIFDKNKIVDINLERIHFTFTRNLSTWNESTTVKYNGKSLAEIQIHKNRTFKFRFVMNTLSDLLIEQQTTNETFGITAEKTICDIFGIATPEEYHNRYSLVLEREIKPTIVRAFKSLPKAIKSTGAEQGERGENSKCSYDFILQGNKTLSLKTNTGKMICPPEVGQPSPSTCYLYFNKYIESKEMTSEVFKQMVYDHIDEIMPIYIDHLFDSDYLLWIYKRKNQYEYKIYDSDFARNITWKKELFSFTKPTIAEWNESNTLKYNEITIGEFQVHKNRACFKFRFNMENFENLIIGKYI